MKQRLNPDQANAVIYSAVCFLQTYDRRYEARAMCNLWLQSNIHNNFATIIKNLPQLVSLSVTAQRLNALFIDNYGVRTPPIVSLRMRRTFKLSLHKSTSFYFKTKTFILYT